VNNDECAADTQFENLGCLKLRWNAIAKQDDVIPPYKIPTFNAAPSQLLPVVYLDETGKRIIAGDEVGIRSRLERARNRSLHPSMPCPETAQHHECFARHSRARRCLIPADGFYEPKGPKTQKHRPCRFLSDARQVAHSLSAGCGRDGIHPRAGRYVCDPDNKCRTNLWGKSMSASLSSSTAKDYAKWLEPKTPADEITPDVEGDRG